MAPPARLLLISAACAVALAACGGGNVATSTSGSTTSGPGQAGTSTGQAGTSTTAGATTGPAPTSTAPIAVGTIPASELSPSGKPGRAPTLRVPSGKPPAQLEEADLISGNGPVARAGDNVTMQYVLGTYSTHKVVQSSWTTSPFSFTLGIGQVVPGFDRGVQGMKVGGRRELIIPPQLGYGARSPGAGIAPNDTLVFIVDLVKIN